MGDITVQEFMTGVAPQTPQQWSREERDAAKRAADIVNELRAHIDWDTLRQCWIAIRLSDGGSDGVLYDSKRTAVQHQLHEQQCAYIAFRNLIGGASEREMLRFLRFNRMAYEAGMRLPDPDAVDGGPDLAPTSGWMDYMVGKVRHRV